MVSHLVIHIRKNCDFSCAKNGCAAKPFITHQAATQHAARQKYPPPAQVARRSCEEKYADFAAEIFRISEFIYNFVSDKTKQQFNGSPNYTDR